ncbi:unnamed protein product [Parnassius apollo]|uniref:(apollo) hypothetical protein n=1 Tax=Parnassius apollo TaxID=110799 RepID=A0A8S3WUE4_PARAO|nr:unnamed protein product [Parnassius apollo]
MAKNTGVLHEIRWMLGRCSGKEMSNQAGLKHVPTEPTQLESKRSRRRAGGRAAALRRAPSDSDCSGETASLSADSAERAPRVPPPTTRQTKSRSSRRRGSEWEVLEGLKDGQRFDKRPEVFNGYLHKKRKWPLKGWHKRFFVVDGGILVYARSPSDVARGRLHGSVDVGLSVISAKARRRRIDIDADEFIYHLRAKTPEVFRTWLNVLKAHRLYRQHLLTFGARESVPKIHAPLEELPPTETSSQSMSRTETSTLSSSECTRTDSQTTWASSALFPTFSYKKLCANIPLKNWSRKFLNKYDLKPLKYQFMDDVNSKSNKLPLKHASLCSMNYVERTRNIPNKFENTQNESKSLKAHVEREMLMHSTELDVRIGSTGLESLLCAYSLNSPNRKVSPLKKSKDKEKKIGTSQCGKDAKRTTLTQTERTLFCFTHKSRPFSANKKQPFLKRSMKSTNVVKYKNVVNEPPLKHPFNKCTLLGKCNKLKISRHSDIRPAKVLHTSRNSNVLEIISNVKKLESLQDSFIGSDFDKMTEKLTEAVVKKYNKSHIIQNECLLKSFINQIVKEMYSVSCDNNDENLEKALFKCLLEYWIQNTSTEKRDPISKEVKSIGRPSNNYFTQDQNTSTLFIPNYTKETQFYGIGDTITKKKPGFLITTSVTQLQEKKSSDRKSFDKERRIQELERLLKNTVYCENLQTAQRKEEDIKITKTLIDNIGKMSRNVSKPYALPELPELQNTIDHLLSETSLPPDLAKEFFSAYLNLLRNESTDDSSVLTTDTSKIIEHSSQPMCEVLAECALKTLSHGLMAKNCNENNHIIQNLPLKDSGQTYLNIVLNKITTESGNGCNFDSQKLNSRNETIPKDTHKDKLKTCAKICPNANSDQIDKADIISFSKYNLEHISTTSIPLITAEIPIAIKLKEPPNLDFEFTEKLNLIHNAWFLNTNLNKSSSDQIFNAIVFDHSANHNKNSYLDYNYDIKNERISVKPYYSSQTTSKIQGVKNNSEYNPISNNCPYFVYDPQTCVLMAMREECLQTNLHSKEKTNLDKALEILPNASIHVSESTELSSQEEAGPRMIDEPFILCLLKNLVTFSKHVPTLHKDIRSLYRKLTKKFENIAKDYNNTVIRNVSNKEVGIQFDGFIDIKGPINKSVKTNAETNTIDFITLLSNNRNMGNTSKTSRLPVKEPLNIGIQKGKHIIMSNTKESNYDSVIPNKTNQSISNQSWYMQKCTRNITINSITKAHNHRYNNITRIPVLLEKKSPARNTKQGLVSPTGAPLRGPQAGFVSGTPGGRLAGWIIDSGGPLENASRELGQAQLSVQQLQRLLDALEMQQQVHHDTDVSIEGASPNVKKDRRKFGLRKKKSSNKCASIELAPPHIDPSNSHMALSALTAPSSPGGGASAAPNSAASLPIELNVTCNEV